MDLIVLFDIILYKPLISTLAKINCCKVKVMKNRFLHRYYFSFLLLYFFLSSCNSIKNLKDDEVLLTRNVIRSSNRKFEKSELATYLKQKQNRKVLFWKIHLHIFNSIDAAKLEKIIESKTAKRALYNKNKIEKYKTINAQRMAAGKQSITPKLKKSKPFILREWWRSNGEPPVIYDTLATQKSVKQLKSFLNSKGYFNNTVTDSVRINNRKATVYYTLAEGKPYTIQSVTYDSKDEYIKSIISSQTAASLIKVGENYDVDILQKERERITNVLNNNGYFSFAKESIFFEADSNSGNHQITISVSIKNAFVKDKENNDSLIETEHIRYYLNQIYIFPNYNALSSALTDTLVFNQYRIIYFGKQNFKSRFIADAVSISTGDLFQQAEVDKTYRRLSDLKIFKSVQIQFSMVENNRLNCFIYLTNVPKQSIALETEGINTSGTLGIAGNVVYKNKNVFKGGELFEWKTRGALEVQKTKVQNNTIITPTLPFNTLETGTEANLTTPRFLFPFTIKSSKNNNAKSILSGNYNYQRRPDFGRSLSNVSFGYQWKETETKQHLINPIEFNLINIFNESKQLQATIDKSQDPFLKYSYSDHITIGTRYAFTFNNQDLHKTKDFSFLRIGAEGAGNALREVFNFISLNTNASLQNKDGSFMIDSIPFSQYVRFDLDYRYYKVLNESDRLVGRVALGVGKALTNSKALPLEKSFFAGGPNSIRAWATRTLGPGGYLDSTNTNAADKMGDIKIESNLEYRFNILRSFNGALFMDAGNVWLSNNVDIYPHGRFTGKEFLDQIALGAGMGLRVDFSFFIVRLDGAFKVKDPSLPKNNRWTLGKQPLKDVAINVGIGYPF
jgi:outer membrane protein assembly factor BamA